MQWFKFYGAEYLIDPKMATLTPCERSCWLSLLCYAAAAEDGGRITHLTEEHLMAHSGIEITSDDWGKTRGVLDRFEKLEMITLDNGVITLSNWSKRQGNALSGYERLKRWREKQKGDNDDNVSMITNDNGKRERVERKIDRKKSSNEERESTKKLESIGEVLRSKGVLAPKKKP